MSSAPTPNPLGNNPAASVDVTAKYTKLFLDYKLAVNSAHFQDKSQAGEPLFAWNGPAGIRACEQPPLLAFLAAPRLPADLQQYLQHPHQPPQ